MILLEKILKIGKMILKKNDDPDDFKQETIDTDDYVYQYGKYFVATKCEQHRSISGDDYCYEYEYHLLIARLSDEPIFEEDDSYDVISRSITTGFYHNKLIFEDTYFKKNEYELKLVQSKHHAKRADYFERGLQQDYWKLRNEIREYEKDNLPLLQWEPKHFAHFRLTIE